MLATAHPSLAPTETMVHLLARIRMGWLLTPEGRATGVVPPDFTQLGADCGPAPASARSAAHSGATGPAGPNS